MFFYACVAMVSFGFYYVLPGLVLRSNGFAADVGDAVPCLGVGANVGVGAGVGVNDGVGVGVAPGPGVGVAASAPHAAASSARVVARARSRGFDRMVLARPRAALE